MVKNQNEMIKLHGQVSSEINIVVHIKEMSMNKSCGGTRYDCINMLPLHSSLVKFHFRC